MSYTSTQGSIKRSVSEMERALRSAKSWSVVKGQTATCPSPKHDDKHPSGWVKVGGDGIVRFSCQSCKWHGDVFDVMAVAQGRRVEDLLAEIREKDEGPSKKPVRSFPDVDAMCRAVPGKLEGCFRYTNPDTNSDDLVVVRYRDSNGKKHFWQAHWDKRQITLRKPTGLLPLYNRAGIREADTVVVVEGEGKVDVLGQYGFAATTASGGAGKAKLTNWRDVAGKNAILWPDHDGAGHDHMRDAESIVGGLEPRARASWIDPSSLDLTEKEDVVDFVRQLRALGKTDEEITAELRRVLSGAKPLGPLERYRQRQAAIARGEIRCIAWPWPQLTKWTRALQPGRVTIIAGKKGSAKSFLLLQSALYWLAEGESAAVMILEGTVDEYLDRALAQLSGNADVTDLEWVRDHYTEAATLADQYSDDLARLQASLTRSDINITLEQVADWTEAQAKAGRRLIGIDPISAAVRTNKPWVADPAFLNRIRAIAEDHKCSTVLVTHLQKGANEFTPDALAGSACYERFSDTIVQLHRHDARKSLVKLEMGRIEVTHNSTIFLEKCRAPGTGLKIAYNLDAATLQLDEVGVILRKDTK